MAGSQAPTPALVQALFTAPTERWGWEYRDPGHNPNPYTDGRPRLIEPSPLGEDELRDLREKMQEEDSNQRVHAYLGMGLLVLGALFIYSFFFGGEGAENEGWIQLVLGFPAAVAGLLFVASCSPDVEPDSVIDALQRERSEEIEKARSSHRLELDVWRRSFDAWERGERARRDAATVFYPLSPRSSVMRTDVVGGSEAGWVSVLATFGSSALAGGAAMLVLDLSEWGIGRGFAGLAGAAGYRVRRWELPADLPLLALLDDLSVDEVTELLAGALHSARPGDTDLAMRTLDSDILRAVVGRLAGRVTLARIAAGLRVLEGADGGDITAVLTAEEITRIVAGMDRFSRSERAQDEVRHVRASLELLAGPPAGWAAAAVPADESWWPPARGLRIVETSTRTTSGPGKMFIDRVVFQTVLHHLRQRRATPAGLVLVVAGADHIGYSALQEMALFAARSRVRLVFVYRGLSEDVERLIGTQGSATVIMQLGNTREAEAASRFIGRGHSFVFSQLTAQIGRTLTAGVADSTGGQQGWSSTRGGSSSSHGGSSNWSVSESLSNSWQSTRNLAVADSDSQGATVQRVYEFVVEPTRIQGLPDTAFLLVDSMDGDRVARSGDCNPGIALLPNTAVERPLPGGTPSPPETSGRNPGWDWAPTSGMEFPSSDGSGFGGFWSPAGG